MLLSSIRHARSTEKFTEHPDGCSIFHLVEERDSAWGSCRIDVIVVPSGVVHNFSNLSSESGLVVLDGEGVATASRNVLPLVRGSVLQIADTGRFSIRSTGDESLRMICYSGAFRAVEAAGGPLNRVFHLSDVEDNNFHMPEQGFFNLSARWLLDEAHGKTKTFTLGQSTFAANSGSHELHRHPDAEEAFFVWEGQGMHLTESGEVPVAAGELVFVPRNEWHGFRNTGDIPVRAIFGYLGANSLEAGGYELPATTTG